MATVPRSPNTPPPPSSPDTEPPKAFADDPDADLILRSCDSQEFRVLKLFVIKNSPVLDKQIPVSSEPPQPAFSADNQSLLPVVQLPDNGVILSSLLTFIFPVPMVLPPTLEETMQLLSVAQKYEMASVLSHIRNCIASKDPPLICPENAHHVYILAQKHGLRQEVAKAARLTLTFTLTIENLGDKHDVMPGAYLYELWNYHKNVKRNLKSHIKEFIGSCRADNTLLGQNCVSLSPRGVPRWLGDYLTSIAMAPSSFNPIEFHKTLAYHIFDGRTSWMPLSRNPCESCSDIPNESLNTLWTALTNFVNGNIAKAESTLSILGSGWESCTYDRTTPPAAVLPLPEYLYSCKADIILQSSDLVSFRVHKSILAISSQFFRAMFSLPQPPTEIANELPVVPMSEDAEIVRALITVLYPIPSEIPVAYDRALSLLAASQKYDMPAAQLSIRSEIRHRMPAARTGDEAFRAYAIASRNRLSPETSTTAYLTLDYTLTFESLGSELRLFEGWALRDLVRYRKLRRDDIVSCFESFLDNRVGPSKIWVGCLDESSNSSHAGTANPTLPSWLEELFTSQIRRLGENFMSPIMKPSEIRGKYLAALQKHAAGNETQKGCEFCLRVHARQGEEYCLELERKLAHARDQVFVGEDT